MEYQTHEIATLFPLMSEERLAELAEEIAQNGQLEPVVLYEDKALDGRNRVAACKRKGIEPRTEKYTGKLDPLTYRSSRRKRDSGSWKS
jgi:ParB-like chromosome segregation protein Spo0J